MTYTATKEKLTISLAEATDDKLRNLAFKHRKTHSLSAITEAMIVHCLSDRKFLNSLTKKEEAIDY